MKEEYIDIDSYPFSGDISYYQYCFQCLLPKYNTWVAQSAAQSGDKSNCAVNFLFKILPYLVTTVIQNGIYFIQDFPDHEFSKFLIFSIREYTQFAVYQRQKVKEAVARYQQEKVNQLDLLGDNVCTVIGALQRELEVTNNSLNQHREMFQQQVITMQQQMINLQTSFLRQSQTLDRISTIQEQLTNNIAQMNTRQEQICGLIEDLRTNNNNPTNNVLQNENNNTINVNVVIPPVPQNPTQNELIAAAAQENTDNNVLEPDQIIQNQRNRRPRMNGLLAIRGTPRVPPMQVLFPESWLAILEEWNLLNLSSFVGYGRRAHFNVKENSRFSKRSRAINQIRRAALGRGFSLRDTAEQLDVERNFRIQQARVNGIGPQRFSLTNHLEELERNDPRIRRRGNPQEN